MKRRRNIHDRVRVLEEQVARLSSSVVLLNEQLDAMRAADTSADPLPVTPRASMRAICARHALANCLTVEDLRSRSVKRTVAWPRQDAMAEMRAAGFSLLQIAAFFGRDHTTVLHGIRSAQLRGRAEEKSSESSLSLADALRAGYDESGPETVRQHHPGPDHSEPAGEVRTMADAAIIPIPAHCATVNVSRPQAGAA